MREQEYGTVEGAVDALRDNAQVDEKLTQAMGSGWEELLKAGLKAEEQEYLLEGLRSLESTASMDPEGVVKLVSGIFPAQLPDVAAFKQGLEEFITDYATEIILVGLEDSAVIEEIQQQLEGATETLEELRHMVVQALVEAFLGALAQCLADANAWADDAERFLAS